jgi:hypothetical protein
VFPLERSRWLTSTDAAKARASATNACGGSKFGSSQSSRVRSTRDSSGRLVSHRTPPAWRRSFDAELTHWLDPIAGLDQRAEILRASVSILVAQGEAIARPLAGVLVTAWLQTQNLTDRHRQELSGLAVRLPDALLDAIEHSANYAQLSKSTSPRSLSWASNAAPSAWATTSGLKRCVPPDPGTVSRPSMMSLSRANTSPSDKSGRLAVSPRVFIEKSRAPSR